MEIPDTIRSVLDKLSAAGFEAYAVGGCVRDVLLKKIPKDWDVATNAKPEEIQKIFPKNFYTNAFGTVTVLTETHPNPPLSGRGVKKDFSPDKGELKGVSQVEVTTYRVEDEYNDQRHPDRVTFVATIQEDLARRDFTINAMALSPSPDKGRGGGVSETGQTPASSPLSGGEPIIIDPFGGQKDLTAKLIRAVGDPKKRFSEDALRLLRAIRLASELDLEIEEKTLEAIREYASTISAVSHERIRDELIKLVMSNRPEKGMNLLQNTGLVGLVLPEVAEGIGVDQNKHHIYTVFEHSIKSLQFAAQYNYPLEIRLAALFHDIGKPRTRRRKDGDYTFYAHDVVGARMAETLMKRLHFSRAMIEKVTHLIRHHMFYYDVGKVTEAGARRLLRRVGKEHFDDLIKLRIAERKGSGVPKAEPYRLRHLQFLVEKAAQEPVSVSELKITGKHLQQGLGLTPGPIFGGILNALLAEVLDDPKKNTEEYLLKRAAELKDKNPGELKKLGEAAADAEEKRREDDIRRKYHV